MTKRQNRKHTRGVPTGKPPAAAKPTGTAADAVLQCVDIQEHLTRAQELSRRWEEERRAAIRHAFELGASSAELSAALGISRSKVYQLMGTARAPRLANHL